MLDKLFGSKLRAALIARLFSRTGERFFVRQLSALLNEDPANVSRELARMEGLGLLASTVEGRQKYYWADAACPMFPGLKNLIMRTAGLADVLREALTPVAKGIQSAFVYGSLASGTETPESDVDLFIVGRVSLRKLSPALRRAGGTLMREINPVVMTPAELVSRIRDHGDFMTAVLESPKVFLIGGEDDFKRVDQQGLSRKA